MERLAPQAEIIHYRQLGLWTLLERVARESDRTALEEFHENRRPFGIGGGRPVRLVDFARRLGELAMARNGNGHGHLGDETVERAVSLTIDKFSMLPALVEATQSRAPGNGNHAGPRQTDCRHYFLAFLRKWEQARRSLPPLDDLEEELLAARLLQGHVRRHFELSLKEARRGANPLVTRYPWHLNGGRLYVWFPRHFPPRERRAWLEAHVDEPNPQRPGEKVRVQSIIDAHLARERRLDLGDVQGAETSSRDHDGLLSWALLYGISDEGLAEVVAQEKARRLGEQRPAIRALGAPKLMDLIREIFERLDGTELKLDSLAARYGASKASLCRFAAVRWQKRRCGKYRIPDLWVNTARVLAAVAGFREAAQATGVWPKVREVLCQAEQETARRRRDE